MTIADSQLLLPQTEWDVLAAEARQAQSFALQLQGKRATELIHALITGLIAGLHAQQHAAFAWFLLLGWGPVMHHGLLVLLCTLC